MKKALYFGSFNPVHYGHVSIARYVADMEETDAVIIIPSPHNPFKDTSTLADPQLRLRQVRTAFEGISPKITVSDIEYRLQEPLYTINTLNTLSEKFPDDSFVLVIGADNWSIFNRWRCADEIIARFEIYVYPRRGYEISIPDELQGKVKALNSPLIEISSTMVREKLARGENLSFYLPDDVYKYILKHNLYTSTK